MRFTGTTHEVGYGHASQYIVTVHDLQTGKRVGFPEYPFDDVHVARQASRLTARVLSETMNAANHALRKRAVWTLALAIYSAAITLAFLWS